MPGTVYTVASGKGGVGKTTTSVNLAVALWREGNAVALVDADIGMANLAAVLDLEPEETLHDVLAGRATVEEAVIEAKDGDLMVLPGSRSLDSFADADPNALRAAVSDLAGRADYVIVDTGAGLSYEDVLPLGMADGVVLVTTPDPAAFGDTMKTMEIADILGAPIRGLVVTRAVEDTDAEAIAAEIGAELLGTIPEDPAVMASTVAGDPLESHAPDSEAAAAYRGLADTLLEGDEEWLAEHAREPADELERAGGGESFDESDPADEAPAAPDERDPEPSGSTVATDDPANGSAAPEPEDALAADDTSTGVDVDDTDDADDTDDVDDAHDAHDDVSTEADESGSGEAAVSEADPTPAATSDDDLEAGEPADVADEPATFPAGGVQREGRATDGEATDEGDDTAGDDETNEVGDEDVVGDVDEEDGDDEAVGEGGGEAGSEGDDEAGAATAEGEAKRGGFFGWFGRLFS